MAGRTAEEDDFKCVLKGSVQCSVDSQTRYEGKSALVLVVDQQEDVDLEDRIHFEVLHNY